MDSVLRACERRDWRPAPVWIDRRRWVGVQCLSLEGLYLTLIPLIPIRRPFPDPDWSYAGLAVFLGSHRYRLGSWCDRLIVDLAD
jgi:hypothetical protein